MKNVLIVFAVLSLFVIYPLSFSVFAQDEVSTGSDSGIILFMQGDVKVKSAQSEIWINGEKGMILSNGDNLKTGSGSWAELSFGRDFRNSVRVQGNTHIVLTDLGAIKINLIQGELRSLVEKLSKNVIFEIKTPVSVCGVRGTGWDTITNGKTAETDVYENNVYFSGISEESGAKGTIIDEGKMGILSDPTGIISIEDLPIDKINDWNKWKEDFTERRNAEIGSESSGGGNAAGQVSSAESRQAAAERMDKSKEAIFQADEQKEIDKKLRENASKGGQNLESY
jgi:FecR protein